MQPQKYPRKTPRRERTNLSSSSESEKNKDPVHVFCRLKPLAEDGDQPCIDIVSPTVVSVSSPSDKYPRKDSQHVFCKVFAPGSSQKEVFETVAYPMLEDLLQGKNGLLFTYGVTGSGKTYTLTGDYNDPGIMPRCINTLFNTVFDYQANKFIIKSDRMNGFEIQTEKDAANDRFIESKSSSSGSLKKKTADVKNTYFNDDLKVHNFIDKNLYAVFISYIEIYNNTVFDLLDETSGKQLQSKILREDSQKNMYVNNVLEVEVKSAAEAFEVFNLGQKRKRVGHTLLNAESSRSHSIFNIRVVQLEKEIPGQTALIPERNYLKVGQLSLVDLAGSERCSRTQNTGMRLKEASCINNSLMSLRTCLEILRDNQLNNANRLVPYRDTRLTLYFKNYFEGGGRVQMIVCVNPSIRDYEENQQVMKFAELSQDVKVNKGISRYTPYGKIQKIKNTPQTPATVVKVSKSVPIIFGPQIPKLKFNYDNQAECLAMVNNVVQLLKARRENAAAYNRQCDRMEREFRNRLIEINKESTLAKSEIRNMQMILKLEKVKVANLETKAIDLVTLNNDLVANQQVYEGAIKKLQTVIDEKDLKINQNYIEQERVKQKIELHKEKQSQELDACLRRQREELNAQMFAKERKLQKVKQVLDDYECPVPNSPLLTNIGETQTNYIQKIESEVQTFDFHELIKTPSTRSRQVSSSHIRRRSRSAGDVWLEHNSVKPLPLGTVLQPTIKKRKSVTKLKKASDVTNSKQSKYCLIAQEADSDGELETKVYKADILPTCGGGAQVIFNDVERLRQESPTGSPHK